jgi:hypothetical protein
LFFAAAASSVLSIFMTLLAQQSGVSPTSHKTVGKSANGMVIEILTLDIKPGRRDVS